MTLIEFIGFIITFFALIFLFGQQMREERRRQRDPEGYAQEQEEKERGIQAFYQELLPPPPKKPKIEIFEEEEEIPLPPRDPPVEKLAKTPMSPIQKMVSELPDKRKILIMHTIFSPPKSLE